VPIDLNLLEHAGSASAPVTMVIYISGTCPMCKRVIDEMHKEVTAGALRDKARLVVKLFTTNTVDKTLLAANEYGKFWPFVAELAQVKQRITTDDLMRIILKLGIPAAKMAELSESRAVGEKAETSRAEALRNGVKETPAVFINGHRYEGYKHPAWLIDAVDYECERLTRRH
jgi:protein-disulfide isomerase